MRHILSLLTAVLLAPLAAMHASDAPQQKPNVVFVFTDDQPHSAMGCMGNPHLATPHVDRPAKERVLFENSLVTTSICCVSRASIFTSQHMARYGIRSFDTPPSPGQLAKTEPAPASRGRLRPGASAPVKPHPRTDSGARNETGSIRHS